MKTLLVKLSKKNWLIWGLFILSAIISISQANNNDFSVEKIAMLLTYAFALQLSITRINNE